MSYRIELRQQGYNGPELTTAATTERYDSLVRASRVAKQEAFVLSNTLGVAVAVIICEQDKPIIRHVVPARHDETRHPLYSRHGLHTTMEMDGESQAPLLPLREHPLIATTARPVVQPTPRQDTAPRDAHGKAAAA